MDPLTEQQIRGSFVNATKGEAARVGVPRDLDQVRWDELDFVAWVDPRSPLSGYLVVPTPTHGLVGIQVRRSGVDAPRRARMCDLCTTTQRGDAVALMVAPRAGRAGRDGNTVGVQMCSGLECSAHARGTIKPPGAQLVEETLTVEERLDRLRHNVLGFVDRVVA